MSILRVPCGHRAPPVQQLIHNLALYKFENYFPNFVFSKKPVMRFSVAFPDAKERVGIMVFTKNANFDYARFKVRINEAVALGWRVFVVGREEIDSPQFTSQLKRALGRKEQ